MPMKRRSTAHSPASPAARRARGGLAGLFALALLACPQGPNQGALRFFGTGTDQRDRALIPVDDDGPGPDASRGCDVGAGSFTLEIWVKGTLADNPTPGWGGGVERFDSGWIDGNIVLDRDIWGGAARLRDFGVSIAGGRVRFGTGRGERDASEHTLEGSAQILDGAWHHVAAVRDAATGVKRIYVDGELDAASSPGVSQGDISYPDAVPGGTTAFAGAVDELRIWNVARSESEIRTGRRLVPAAQTPGLVGYYRFDERSGTALADATGRCAPGTLVAGEPGNGDWLAASQGAGTVPSLTGVADTDGDGVPDDTDVCLLAADPDQRDTDGDGYGNRCDPDLDQSGLVNTIDLALFRAALFTTDPDADFDGDGTVSLSDLAILKEFFLAAPGPSLVGGP
jgi:hypothetical protein